MPNDRPLFCENFMVDCTFKTFQERNSDLPCIQDTISVMLECRKKKEEKSSLSYAIHVHDCMVSNGLESIDSVKNHLVPLFVDCGSLAAAEQAFHSLHIRSEHSWTSLIKAYTHVEFCSLQAFTLLDQMERDGVQPSRHTFMHLLSFCGSFFMLEMGQNIHSKMIKEGHYHHDINELFLTNALVALYGKCGLLIDARTVFNQAPIRDIYLWNTLISLYVEQNFSEEAILCLKSMEIEGISLDATTFRHILKACVSTGDYDSAKFFHHLLIAKGCEMETSLIESLVDIYTPWKGFVDAEAVVKALPIPDVESSIVLMEAYSKSGSSNRVLDCKKQMDSDSLFPLNPAVFVYSLKACGDLRDLDHGRVLHLEVEKYGFGESTVASALITMYSKCGSLLEAQKVFDEMNGRDTVAWTIMLVAYSEHGFMQEALGTLCDMQADNNARLDSVACVCGLKACGTIKDMAKGREIHAEVIKEGFETSLLVCNTLLDMYAKGGLLMEACDVFNELFIRDVVAWNTLIDAYVGNELYDEALGLLENIRNEGIAPNESTLVNILKACCYAGYRNEGQKIHTYIIELGFERDAFIESILLDMYCRCGYLIEAQHLFDAFPVRTAMTWSILISGYTVNGLASEALKHSEQMQLEGIYADVDVVLCILKACSNSRSIKKGREAHSYIMKVGFQDNPIVGGALVHFYAKCGQLFEAEEILSMLPVQDVVSWSGLIEGFVDLGLAEHALCCYNQMRLEGVSPNAITLFPILKACGDIGALGIGREIHMEAMKEELESDIYVNNTLIDMYAKCGAILEALDLLDEQPQLHDVVAWSSVISGCVDQGEINTAFSLYKEMQEEGVAPNEVTIMSLLKAYGSIGALEAGKRIHAQMKLNFAADAMFTTALLDMYAKCGCMIDAQVLFNTISRLDIVALNALSNGYARHGQSDLVIYLFERMKEEGIRPDETTFLNLLIGCDHDGFVGKGQEYFFSLCRENISSDKHRDCMVDILGRAGRLEEASLLMQEMPLHTQGIGWINLLAASRKLGNLEAGKLIFECATDVSKMNSAAFVLMANIYAETRDAD